MVVLDACCWQCGHGFRWLSGTPLRCPSCHQFLRPQPINCGQYLEENTQRLKSQEDVGVDVQANPRTPPFEGVQIRNK